MVLGGPPVVEVEVAVLKLVAAVVMRVVEVTSVNGMDDVLLDDDVVVVVATTTALLPCPPLERFKELYNKPPPPTRTLVTITAITMTFATVEAACDNLNVNFCLATT
ncbi:MAG: hypothetical protein ACREBS_02945 [Nitrososphaerales archaeon]